MCFPLALRLFVTDWGWLQHNGQRLKSITQCLISFPLTAHLLVLHKIQTPNGSSPWATETRATSGTVARLLMQLHNVASQLFTEFQKIVNNFTNLPFCSCIVDCLVFMFLQKQVKTLQIFACVCAWISVFACVCYRWSHCNEGEKCRREVSYAELS